MKKRNIIIIGVLLLAIGAYTVYSFTKKPEPKYTTAKVIRGVVLQTVSATGTVEAEMKLDLRFMNSGKIEKINIKVGDDVKEGEVLAKLDTSQLESQLTKAKAGLNATTANLNKLLEGATYEDIRVSQTAVENAQIALSNAQINLLDTETSAEKDIANAVASVANAQVALNSANQSLTNTEISNENNLNQDHDSAWNTINSSLLIAYNSLDTNQTVLDDDDAQDTLSVLNTQYLNNSSQSKTIANNSYNNIKDYIDDIGVNPTRENVGQALTELKNALEDIKITLNDTSNVLGATITSSKLSQAELDALKLSISTARTNINTAITNLTTAQQNISTQEVANQTSLDGAQASVNSAVSSLNLMERSLSAVQAGADTRINTAENTVQSAEGSLKQAQDQLALKKAGPRSADVLLHRAQVQEAQASIELIQDQIGDSILVAPQGGLVTEINSEVGELASSSTIFLSIIATDNFEIKSNISEVDIAKVKIGDEVEISFDAFGTDKIFKGKITEIDPAQTEISGVIYYKITAIFTGNAEVVKQGMTANLDIMTAKRDNALMIPFQALKERDGQKYTQVLRDGKAKDILVEVGLKGDINLEIINGLTEGQEVVTFMEE
ncbi:MAG: efflux RND transporter periplasmic adaptor subunit [Patescibacteria group bacterium]|nr:efflux RND transporter periplasmic adaptor subunit [Patescibacteria group bacterium]